MKTIADLRDGRSPRVTVVATASTFVPITLVAWATWLALEREAGSHFGVWIVFTLGLAVLTQMTARVFWRTPRHALA